MIEFEITGFQKELQDLIRQRDREGWQLVTVYPDIDRSGKTTGLYVAVFQRAEITVGRGFEKANE